MLIRHRSPLSLVSLLLRAWFPGHILSILREFTPKWIRVAISSSLSGLQCLNEYEHCPSDGKGLGAMSVLKWDGDVLTRSDFPVRAQELDLSHICFSFRIFGDQKICVASFVNLRPNGVSVIRRCLVPFCARSKQKPTVLPVCARRKAKTLQKWPWFPISVRNTCLEHPVKFCFSFEKENLHHAKD